MAEFSDMAMPRPPDAHVDKNDYMAAEYVTSYLESYIEKHVYAGQSIKDRIMLGLKATNVRKGDQGWTISGVLAPDTAAILRARKVIIATGLTSAPQMPDLPGLQQFNGPAIHQEAFGSSGVLESPQIHHVSVLGGAKSAADMVYASVKAGKHVSWVIRASGAGPAAFVGGEGNGRFKNAAESGATRFLGSMSPSIFLRQTWWTWFIHRTWIGRWLGSKVWEIATEKSQSVFKSPPAGAKPSFSSLRPTVE